MLCGQVPAAHGTETTLLTSTGHVKAMRQPNTMGIVEKDVKSFVDALEGLDGIESGALEETIIDQLRKLEPLT